MGQLLAKLGVDWMLLLAQAVNFALMLGVLTYFVYRPLLDLLDRRREKIQKSMEDADRIARQVDEMEKLRDEQMRKIDVEAGVFLEKAKKQASAAAEAIIADAKAESDQLLAKGQRQLEVDRAQVMVEVQASLVAVIVRMTEKILEREFTPKDQERIVSALGKELPSLLR